MPIARFARPAVVALALVLALALSAVALLVMNSHTHATASGRANTAGTDSGAGTGAGTNTAGTNTAGTTILTDVVAGGAPVGIRHLNRATPLMSVSSQNWAGYVASNNHFRYVQATFTVPALNCRKTPGSAKTPAMVGVWVGLDGMGGRVVTVEQDGIAGQCVRGVPSYSAWWEMYPKPPVYSGMAIRPHDVIRASVYYNSRNRQYQLVLTNLTTRQGFSTWRRCGASSCRNASAEVITESPSVAVSGNRLYPLADFGTVSYSHIQVTDTAGQRGGFGSSRWQDTELVMTDTGGAVKAATSGLSHGVAFNNYWKRAS